MSTIRRSWASFVVWLVACGAPEAAEHHDHHDEHEESGATEVTLSEIAIERSGIVVGAVAREPLGGGATVPAEIQADPAFTAHVAAVVTSRITSVDVAVGERVVAGQVLGTVASGDVSASRGALAEARVRRDAARAERDRQAALVESGIAARRSLVSAEAELAAIEAEMRGIGGGLRVVGRGGGAGAQIVAPIGGVVVARHATVGEVAQVGDPLFTITEPDRLWVVAQVPELDLSRAVEGAAGVLSVAAFPGARWSGHVDFVAPAFDEETRTLPVRFVLDAPDPRLRAGLFGRLALAGPDAGATGLVVPREALARLDGVEVVFVPAEAPGSFRPVPVTTGRRDGDVVEITEGLDEGAPIVTHGAFVLRSEMTRGELAEHEH